MRSGIATALSDPQLFYFHEKRETYDLPATVYRVRIAPEADVRFRNNPRRRCIYIVETLRVRAEREIFSAANLLLLADF